MFSHSEIPVFLSSNYFRIILHPFFWLSIGLTILMYRRIEGTGKKLFGRPYSSFWPTTIKSIILGFCGGFIAAILLFLLGIPVNLLGIVYIWPILIVLALINFRFICFAYAGGILAVISVLLGYLAEIFPQITQYNILAGILRIYLPGLLILVAVLHLIEALLVFIGGHWGAVPVFFKDKKGLITGGFSLQRIWPLPFLLVLLIPESMASINSGEAMIASNIIPPMPQWWPLLRYGLENIIKEPFILPSVFTVIAFLGYGDFAYSSTPRQKAYSSAFLLTIYSISLFTIALLADFYPFMILPACLFAPLGHEVVVYLGNYQEFSRESRYKAPLRGVKILAVFPDTPADMIGLKSEDIIEGVNGIAVEDSFHFSELLAASLPVIRLTVNRDERIFNEIIKKPSSPEGEIVEPIRKKKLSPLGMILVPDKNVSAYMEIGSQSLFRRIADKMAK